MKSTAKNRRILVLMLTSQILLTLFVLQWLRAQYRMEKDRLEVLLTGLYIDARDEIVDTILFKSFVTPALMGKDNGKDTVYIKDLSGNTQEPAPIKHFERKSEITVRLDHNTDSTSDDTSSLGKLDNDILLRSVRLIVSHSSDQGKNVPLVKELNMLKDSAVFKQHFSDRLKDSGLKFMLIWKTEDEFNGKHKTKQTILLDPVSQFALPGVSVSGYNRYLAEKLLPQLSFGFLLVLITGLAFILSYRSLREHSIMTAMRNEFISNMTHELKTPVSTISIALESLSKYNMKSEREKIIEYLSLASSETKRLEELINRVLDQSVMEDSFKPQNMAFCDPALIIADAVGIMQRRLGNSGSVEFLNQLGEKSIKCDQLMLKGVILNLIDNSIKYCDKDPVIIVSLKADNKNIIIEVSDNGPGIPVEYQSKIFEKFFRIPSGNIHNVKGYGLGLSFAYQVVTLHNGTINVSNCNPGCNFIIKIPEA
ncbi:MAG TPA: HAMP domain-containing sensor histidine kinase [Bacteroidales bacterium]|nr:HAMP domain-containing sensor histidine kinase [Bacteroidales bacterium]